MTKRSQRLINIKNHKIWIPPLENCSGKSSNLTRIHTLTNESSNCTKTTTPTTTYAALGPDGFAAGERGPLRQRGGRRVFPSPFPPLPHSSTVHPLPSIKPTTNCSGVPFTEKVSPLLFLEGGTFRRTPDASV